MINHPYLDWQELYNLIEKYDNGEFTIIIPTLCLGPYECHCYKFIPYIMWVDILMPEDVMKLFPVLYETHNNLTVRVSRSLRVNHSVEKWYVRIEIQDNDKYAQVRDKFMHEHVRLIGKDDEGHYLYVCNAESETIVEHLTPDGIRWLFRPVENYCVIADGEVLDSKITYFENE